MKLCQLSILTTSTNSNVDIALIRQFYVFCYFCIYRSIPFINKYVNDAKSVANKMQRTLTVLANEEDSHSIIQCYGSNGINKGAKVERVE